MVGAALEEGAALAVEGVEGVVSEAEHLGAEVAVDSGVAGRSEDVSSCALHEACVPLPRSSAGVDPEVQGAGHAALAPLACGAAAAFVFMNCGLSQPLAPSRRRAVLWSR